MAGRVWFYTNTHTQIHTAGLSGLQCRSIIMSPHPTRPTICELSTSSWAVFPKPHTRGREENRLGRDLALCESKQKSLGTMNNKSIQKKKRVSLWGRAERRRGTAVSKRGLALMHCGCWATQRAAPAKVYMQNKSNTMTTKQSQFPLQECGCCSDCRTNDGIRGVDFFFFLSEISLMTV